MNKYLLAISIIFSLLLSNQIFAQTYLISAGDTINTCSGTLYDSGGASGSYGNNENYTITICSETGGSIELFFSQFDLESATYDNLTIYDGPTTGSPLLVPASGSTSLQGETIESTGSCLTLVWETDPSVTYPGFAAEISCGYPCQDFTVDLISPTLPVFPDSIIYACPGIGVEFTGQGNYPNNNTDYFQSDANLTWTWTVTTIDQEQFSGEGMNTLPYNFDVSGASYVTFQATDINGCTYVYPESHLVYVSVPPTFVGTQADPYVVCPGEEVNFEGFVQVEPWTVTIPTIVNECFCADDDHYQEPQCAEFTHNAFEQGQTITSVNDIEALCMQLEHSYLGDLDMWITCPNGQSVDLLSYPNSCNTTYFGEPVDNDGTPCTTPAGIGVLYDYCWTPGATQTIASACSGNSTIPPGNYSPEGSFAGLIGCPINGTWEICFQDNIGSDDGMVCDFELIFDDSILPSDDSIWSFENTYDPSTFVWDGDGIEPNNGGEATAHPLTPGDQIFTFSATDDFGCTYDTTLTIQVLDYDNPNCCVFPTPDAGADVDVCGPTYTFSPVTTSGNTVNWSMVSGPGNVTWQNQTSPNATVTIDAFGTYVFELYEQNETPGCSSTDEIAVNFYPVPNTEFIYTPILCFGDTATITYTGNATDAANYTWGFQDAVVLSGSGQGPYEIKYPDAGQFQITLQVEENGCNSNDTTVTIINPPQMIADLTVEDDPCFESCQGRAVIDVQGGTGSYNYSWPSGNPINPNLCAGSYSLTVTDQNGCTLSRNYTVNQAPELLVTATNSSNATCFGYNDASMSITAQGGTGDLTYTWSQPIGVAGPIVTDVYAGNYFVTVSDENGCIVVEAFQITQPDELLVNVSPSTAICQYDETVIVTDLSGGTAPFTYYWDNGNGPNIGPVNLTVSPDSTTTYSLYVEDSHSCTSNTASMTVTVSPEMVIDSMIIDHNRCYQTCDGSAEIDMSGGIGPFDYSWGSDTYLYEGLCAGIYQVTVTDVIGCSVGRTFQITEPDSITFTYLMEPATCYGYDDGEISIYVEGGTQPYTYLWPNGENTNTMINTAGTYQVTVTDANNCRIEPNLTITQPSRIIVQPGSNSEICISQTAQLYAQATGGVMSYDFVWSDNFGNQYLTHNVDVTPDTTTHYTLTVTDSQGCIGNIETITVNVLPPLEILSVTTSYDTVCPLEPATIYVDAIGGYGGPYLLTLQDGRVVPSPFNVYPEETTMYYITLNDVCGTPSVTDSIEINVYPYSPNVFNSDRTSGCAPLTINFEELSPNQGQTYLWNFGDNGFDIIKNPTHTYTDPGKYTVELTTRNSFGCLNTRSIYEMITVYPKPLASFITEPESVSVLDAEIEFINVSEDAQMAFWFFGDGDSSNLWNPRHQYPDIGTYDIALIVESVHGCKDTATQSITVNSEFTFYAPTAFTPNGDGKNDCFRVCGTGIDPNEFYLVVYDRWGNKVFETETYDHSVKCKACSAGAWDGSNRGDVNKGDQVLENGVYSWYCEFKDWTGIVFKKQGTVNMVR